MPVKLFNALCMRSFKDCVLICVFVFAILKCFFNDLTTNGVVINVSKCNFGQQEMQFLGHLLSRDGISPLPRKVEAINNFPKPSNVKEGRRFLEVVNFYCRFLRHAAETPMRFLAFQKSNKKNDKTPIEWNPAAEEAFSKCTTDLPNSSDDAIGGFLQQKKR